MATTAYQVFAQAMGLMGLLDSAGSADTGDAVAYRSRAVPFLNLLLPECVPASDTFAPAEHADGSFSRAVPLPLTALTEALPLDDGLCRCVLPYGLAAQLLLSEDDTSGKAAFCQQKYEENRALMMRTVPAVPEPIEDVYGASSVSSGARWS